MEEIKEGDSGDGGKGAKIGFLYTMRVLLCHNPVVGSTKLIRAT